MKMRTSFSPYRLQMIKTVGVAAFLAGCAGNAYAGPHEMGMPMGDSKMNQESMSEELMELRAKVARLEAALEKNHRGSDAGKAEMKDSMTMDKQKMKMGMHGKKKGMKMGMQGMKKGMEMKGGGMMGMDGMMGMKMKGMQMMGMMHGDKSMMGKMKGGMGKMKMGQMPQSALPGFPGISHIYHVGATGFFLDHAEHVNLTATQKKQLEKIRDSSEAKQEDFESNIANIEKEIWELTGKDEPDIEAITNKVKEVGGLNVEKRIAFIRAVGEATSKLTDKQRELLVSGNDASSDAHAGHAQ